MSGGGVSSAPARAERPTASPRAPSSATARLSWGLTAALAAALAAGCDNMANQPKVNPYEVYRAATESPPFEEPAGTVARDYAPEPAPPVVTLALLERGRQRFDIYCAVCHGFAGFGDGMVVQRGFPAPPSYHIDRLRRAPIQHFYDVITNGYGAMYSYAQRVAPQDRWAIVAYIRALQAAEDVRAAGATAGSLALTPAERAALK